MNAPSTPKPVGVRPLHSLAKQALLDVIRDTADPSTQKERIMIAWEEGAISAAECELLIHEYGLASA